MMASDAILVIDDFLGKPLAAEPGFMIGYIVGRDRRSRWPGSVGNTAESSGSIPEGPDLDLSLGHIDRGKLSTMIEEAIAKGTAIASTIQKRLRRALM